MMDDDVDDVNDDDDDVNDEDVLKQSLTQRSHKTVAQSGIAVELYTTHTGDGGATPQKSHPNYTLKGVWSGSIPERKEIFFDSGATLTMYGGWLFYGS